MTHMDLLTAAQTAAKLGVSLRTLHRLRESGEITPAGKLPGKTGAFLFHPAEVGRFEAIRKMKAGAAA